MARHGESGTLGPVMQGSTGTGAKYWTTSFDQLEDADCLIKKLTEKLGINHQPDEDYRLLIIDTEKAASLSKLTSVTATFEHVGAFANKELPKKFNAAFTDRAMNADFQAQYKAVYQQAEQQQVFNDWSERFTAFKDFLLAEGHSPAQAELFTERFNMHDQIGNNEHYLGNGLTKNIMPNAQQQYGVVELLNFEHKIVNIDQFTEAEAIIVLPVK